MRLMLRAALTIVLPLSIIVGALQAGERRQPTVKGGQYRVS